MTDTAAQTVTPPPAAPSIFELAGQLLAQVEADVNSGLLPRWPHNLMEAGDHLDVNEHYLFAIVPGMPPAPGEDGRRLPRPRRVGHLHRPLLAGRQPRRRVDHRSRPEVQGLTAMPTQRRNRYSILVTFPANWGELWPGEAALAGRTVVCWYPTQEAALLTARGFRMRGASA